MAAEGLRTAYRTCPFCEATCGLELTLTTPAPGRPAEVVSVRGDTEDVFSRGFVCPKGVALKALHDDPDRLRTPLVKGEDGVHRPVTWDEAFAEIDRRLTPILAEDRDAVAVYLGNPTAHHLSNMLYGPVLLKALRTRNVYSASTVDQFPKQFASALMYGGATTVAVPDLDRTDHLFMLGANPLASNGSMMTAPNARGRLREIRRRGGKIVVVDPRRTRTAAEADEHHPIRPGTDAHLLMAIVHTLFAEGLAAPEARIAALTDGIEAVRELAAPFTPERVAPVTGIAAETIRRLARELAAAPTAAVYGRIGTTTAEFGTVASWLVDVVNLLTGNLDAPGGAMFPKAAAGHANTAGPPGRGRGARAPRWRSRVRGLAEILGELPAVCLAEEIDTPGDGRVRALITVSGNPAVSLPNAARLEAALGELEFMVSLDIYLGETTRHADVILPAPSPLHRSHYDLALLTLAVENVAHYSPAPLGADPDLPDEWLTLLRLTGIIAGAGPNSDLAALDELVARSLIERELASGEHSRIAGATVEEILDRLDPRTGPERLLDLMLRVGPYGDGFGLGRGAPEGLTLAALEQAPHGIHLGPLTPRLPEALRTPSGRVELAPEPIVADVERLVAALARDTDRAPGGLLLIGRRHLRSNNSWMHNLPRLVSGPDRCTLQVHPDDAAARGLSDGEPAELTGRAGRVTAVVEVTDTVMPGVVSLPHGWGHDRPGTALAVASAHPGANSNLVADDLLVDALSGNAVLNGIPVELAPVAAAAPAA